MTRYLVFSVGPVQDFIFTDDPSLYCPWISRVSSILYLDESSFKTLDAAALSFFGDMEV